MLNKSFWVIYFPFNIFSEKKQKKQVLKFEFLRFWRWIPVLSISHYWDNLTDGGDMLRIRDCITIIVPYSTMV